LECLVRGDDDLSDLDKFLIFVSRQFLQTAEGIASEEDPFAAIRRISEKSPWTKENTGRPLTEPVRIAVMACPEISRPARI
jgi:hypothetical protein